MDYKEKYETAIKQAKEELKACGDLDCDAARQILRFFPELKESEDERIREDIISHFARRIEGSSFDEVREKYKIWISWLEKQGEQKPAEEYNITGIGSKNAQGKLGEMIKNLKPVNEVLEQKSAELSEEIPTDLKDIVDKEANAIWKEESSDGCHLVIDSFNMFFGICMQIAEAVVDYKKPAAWSKEDEAVLDALIRRFKGEDIYVSPNSVVKCLECIKEKYTWKPSEEQMKALEHAISCYSGISPTNGHEVFILEIMKEQLKKLREE